MHYLDTRSSRWLPVCRLAGLAMVFLLLTSTGINAQVEEVAPAQEYEAIEESPTVLGDADEAIPTVNYRNSETPYVERQVEQRPISEAAWKEALDNLDYSSDLPEEVRRQRERETAENNRRSGSSSGARSSGSPTMPDVDTAFWGPVFRALAIILLLGLIVFIVFRLMREPKNTVVARDGTAITIHNLEDYIHETDLDRFLKAALAENNYAQAVRVYFLQIIKDLSAQKHIIWSREKTNRTYLREMSSHRASAQFQDATYTYERVWYGNAAIGAPEYTVIEQQMRQMLKAI